MVRYAFPVRLSHPLLNAGLSRRSKLKHAPPRERRLALRPPSGATRDRRKAEDHCALRHHRRLAALLAGGSVRVDFQLDKSMPPSGADLRDLGVVVLSAGLGLK